MNMYDLILKKKKGETLTKEEIEFIVKGYTTGVIPDYQMSAFLMAVCFQGMVDEETSNLTMAMAKSGDMLNLSAIKGIKVDKHSTGGVGDKTSLILGPLVASLGVPVAKMSGRGLGHTGGTIDKLESITGFRTSLSEREFVNLVNKIHIAIAGQTANLAPADKKIYALRDATGTVDQMSLIASSIMSKKLASGADAIVLDVKAGDGAFMKTEKDAQRLAQEMVKIGKSNHRQMVAVISDMDQPLGRNVGNALEVKEAIQTLQGKGPNDLTELVLELGAHMVVAAKVKSNLKDAKTALEENLKNGRAFETFKTFVKAQGGDIKEVEHVELLPEATLIEEVLADRSGYVKHIKTEEVGKIVLALGGGRKEKNSPIDLSVGIELQKKRGDYLYEGESFAVIHANSREQMKQAQKAMQQVFILSNRKVKEEKMIKKIIS